MLPVAFGEATKLIPYVTDADKEYEFVLQWGEATSTGDPEGDVIAASEKIPSREEILAVLPSFIGRIEQIPPVYSAIKINGQRAYTLARKGEAVEMPSRMVEIYALELPGGAFREPCEVSGKLFQGDVCTHARTGYCPAAGNRRTSERTAADKMQANFDLKDAIKLETLKNMVHIDTLTEVLLPIETYLRDIAVIAVSEADAAKLKLGQGLSPAPTESKTPTRMTLWWSAAGRWLR